MIDRQELDLSGPMYTFKSSDIELPATVNFAREILKVTVEKTELISNIGEVVWREFTNHYPEPDEGHVFYKSFNKGEPCYVITVSAIDYIFSSDHVSEYPTVKRFN